MHPQKAPPGKFKNKLICKVVSLKAFAGTCHNGTAAAFKAKISHLCSEKKKGQRIFKSSDVIRVGKAFSF